MTSPVATGAGAMTICSAFCCGVILLKYVAVRMESWQAALGQETTIGPPSTVGAAPPSGPAPPLVCALPLLVPELPLPSEPVPPPLVALPAPALVPVADAPEAEAAVSPLVALVPAAAPEPSLDPGSEPLVATGEPLATPPDGVLLKQLATRTTAAKCVMFLSLTDTRLSLQKTFPLRASGCRAAKRFMDSSLPAYLVAVADGIGIGSPAKKKENT